MKIIQTLFIISGIIPDTGIEAIPLFALLLLSCENAIPLIFLILQILVTVF